MNDKQLLDRLTMKRISLSKGALRLLSALTSIQGRMKKKARFYRRSLQPGKTHTPTTLWKLEADALQSEFNTKLKELLDLTIW